MELNEFRCAEFCSQGFGPKFGGKFCNSSFFRRQTGCRKGESIHGHSDAIKNYSSKRLHFTFVGVGPCLPVLPQTDHPAFVADIGRLELIIIDQRVAAG